MSLKFFFNRKGLVVNSMFVIGWALAGLNIYNLKNQWLLRGNLTNICFIIFLTMAALITAIRFFPWNKKEDRGAGIEDHFEKTAVPTSYILVVVNTVTYFFMKPWILMIITSLMFSAILIVNFILIYFYLQDKDPTAPSYFARSLYKK